MSDAMYGLLPHSDRLPDQPRGRGRYRRYRRDASHESQVTTTPERCHRLLPAVRLRRQHREIPQRPCPAARARSAGRELSRVVPTLGKATLQCR